MKATGLALDDAGRLVSYGWLLAGLPAAYHLARAGRAVRVWDCTVYLLAR